MCQPTWCLALGLFLLATLPVTAEVTGGTISMTMIT